MATKNYLKFDTGPYLKLFVDNSLQSFVRHYDDRGVHFIQAKEEVTADANGEMVTGISQSISDSAERLVIGASQNMSTNVPSSKGLVSGMLVSQDHARRCSLHRETVTGMYVSCTPKCPANAMNNYF